MGMMSRMATIVKSKMNRVLDNAEDPRETLDYSYEKQLELLRNVKRGVVEMVTAKRRLEMQASKVQANLTTLDSQARQALEAGREDLARLALERKQAAVMELQGLDQQVADMEIEQEKLTNAEKRLQAKVQAFRTKKEVIKAQYNAAQAQVRIGSALSGVSEEMGDVSLAIERAGEQDGEYAGARRSDRRVGGGRSARRPGRRQQGRHLPRARKAHFGNQRRGRAGGPQGRHRQEVPSRRPVMIVRILTEGQFNLPGAYVDELNEIDNKLVEVVGNDDAEQFPKVLKSMLDLVRENGTPVPLDELVESDLVLPEPDITLREAEEIFTGEGLIPD